MFVNRWPYGTTLLVTLNHGIFSWSTPTGSISCTLDSVERVTFEWEGRPLEGNGIVRIIRKQGPDLTARFSGMSDPIDAPHYTAAINLRLRALNC